MSQDALQADTDNSEQGSADPWTGLYYKSLRELHSMPAAQQEEIALEGLRTRFDDLRPRLPILRKLAEEQGVTAIDRIEDVARLLFQHSVYKSYPLSFIEKGQFDRMTKWLSGLTTVDLTQLDMTGVETIDDWIDVLDRETPLRIIHSSGTSGKLSFLPRSVDEVDLMIAGWLLYHQEFHGPEVTGLEDVPIIYPAYRTGALAHHRILRRMIDTMFKGDEGMLITLNEGRMSADALSLGGRLQAATQKGELGQIVLSPKLIARRDEFLQNMKEAPTRAKSFFDRVFATYAKRRVGMMASLGQLLDIAISGREMGVSNIFAPDSIVMVGGGWKGRVPPDNWHEIMVDFVGARNIRDGYGMTECMAATRSCEHGHYHLHPFQVPLVLDPVTGDVFPRKGLQTGRLGIFDLGATTYWGGFLTGDKVTIGYDSCACGRTTPAVQKGCVRRYSEEEGGDDKITCAGAPEAHDNALAYLLDTVN